MSAPWITYRPELKVLDCTIRDGGLCNDHAFEDGFVKAVYEACVAAGIDYMELGYKSSKRIFARDKFGAGSSATKPTCGGSWATTPPR